MASLLFILFVGLVAYALFRGVEIRNHIEDLKHIKEQKKSDERIAANKYNRVLRDAFDVLDMALGREGATLKDVVRGAEVGTPFFLSLAQLYPDLKTTLSQAENSVRNNFEEWNRAKQNLNQAITDYNRAVCRFPDSLIASFCGYVQDSLIDQYDLDAALHQEVAERFNA